MRSRSSVPVRRLPTTIYEVAAEAALVIVSIAVVFSFNRLFVDGSFFVPVVAATISAHLLAAAVRWVRGGLLVSIIVSALGLLISLTLLFPPTTVENPERFLGREVIEGFWTDMQLAWEAFQSVVAPTPASGPFLLLVAIAMWVVAFLADWAAFRLRSPAEALIPGTAVFVFGALFAAEQFRVVSTVVVLAAALSFVLLHRLGEARQAGAWLGSGAAERGQSALLKSGAVLVAATLLGGVAVAQALPGYGEDAYYDLSELDPTDEPRVVLSPLVDIRARLVNQPDVEVFTVDSDVKDYWRITSLDVFDGRIWRSRGSFEDAAGPLDTELPSGTVFETANQQFSIKQLGGIWLPAAYEPAEILGVSDGVGLEYEQESGTLIVNRDLADSDGVDYTLLSAVPRRDRATIAAVGDSVPSDIGSRYLDLPDDFSERVRTQAELIVANAGATTPYTKALALQNHFRDPTLFMYDLDVANGHSADRLEEFVFDVRVGYCEQFAGAFAAMARSIGLPARVAVGFTPGDFDTAANVYRVSGRHAHAWPEVWMEDIGWLRFEPTPGRGAPGDEAYTGQPESQASPLPNNPATTLPPIEAPGQQQNNNSFEDELNQSTTTNAPSSDRAEDGVIGADPGRTTRQVLTALGILSFVALLAFGPLVYGMLRARRAHRRAAANNRSRVGLAWRESRAALELLGVRVTDSTTPREVVEPLRKKSPDVREAAETLAEIVTAATFAPDRVDSRRAETAELMASTLVRKARSNHGVKEWWFHHMDPRNVLRSDVGTWGHFMGRPPSTPPTAADEDQSVGASAE
jgi:transglutaminase-like putative cysteine protease